MHCAPRTSAGTVTIPSSSRSPDTIGAMPQAQVPAAVALGRLGGKATAGADVKKRYAAMTAEARSEAKWAKVKGRDEG